MLLAVRRRRGTASAGQGLCPPRGPREDAAPCTPGAAAGRRRRPAAGARRRPAVARAVPGAALGTAGEAERGGDATPRGRRVWPGDPSQPDDGCGGDGGRPRGRWSSGPPRRRACTGGPGVAARHHPVTVAGSPPARVPSCWWWVRRRWRHDRMGPSAVAAVDEEDARAARRRRRRLLRPGRGRPCCSRCTTRPGAGCRSRRWSAYRPPDYWMDFYAVEHATSRTRPARRRCEHGATFVAEVVPDGPQPPPEVRVRAAMGTAADVLARGVARRATCWSSAAGATAGSPACCSAR